jgi:hypothetical protein
MCLRFLEPIPEHNWGMRCGCECTWYDRHSGNLYFDEEPERLESRVVVMSPRHLEVWCKTDGGAYESVPVPRDRVDVLESLLEEMICARVMKS